jgi:HTH-type transcriptional regulator/antitoxin HigA
MTDGNYRNMEIKVIKNTEDYKEALKNIELLIERGVKKGSAEAEKLDVLVTLVQDYETKNFIQTTPDPIDTIEFVMEQQDLRPEDLAPYIGSRSKVSEVLNRARPLSLNMIKALHKGLNIPAEVLLNQSPSKPEKIFDYNKFPINEMKKRGYISQSFSNLENEIKKFFGSIAYKEVATLPLFAKRTIYIRSPRTMNQNSLLVWAVQVVKKAEQIQNAPKYNSELLTPDFLHKVIDISDEDDSISKVTRLLKSIGIILVIELHMPQTYIDGAAIMLNDKNPIVALTLRQDRLDNFWFTLMHELSHVRLHRGKEAELFYDDTKYLRPTNQIEIDADRLAIETMVPQDKWIDSPASILPTPEAVNLLAKELSVHPAVIAGKVRYDRGQYFLLNELVGRGELKKMFEEFKD